MDTNALKKFAQAARNLLIDQVTSKLALVIDPASNARREHPDAMKKLDATIAAKGQRQVVEQVAYTWFNRFTALRFMDVNGYTNPRVVSPADGATRPEILADAMAGNLPKGASANIAALLEDRIPSNNSQAEAYRLLLVHACNQWHGPMPFLFEQIDDYSELLMPEDLLSPSSILVELRKAMTEEACADVEIIGWLYQFYISEKKDQVFAGLKKNVKITAENIPAATQLFTPHWIVRYLVENSLGRLWLLNRPQSKLAAQMDYYIAPEEPETDFLRIDRPEDIRICDPACGSGHMLTYAFDLLYAIYEEEGYEADRIPALILTHNLHGVEIDDRAGALAAFALVMKAAARLGRRKFLRLGVQPHICVMQDVRFTPAEMQDVAAVVGRDLFTDALRETCAQFEQAKNFGSLIVPKLRDPAEVARVVAAKDFSGDLLMRDVQERVLKVLEMAEALSPKYHVVVANPPYAGAKGLNSTLANHLNDYFVKGKSDLMTAFTQRGLQFIVLNGIFAGVTLDSWMFLSSYSAFRDSIFERAFIQSLVHVGWNCFPDGHVYNRGTMFVLCNQRSNNKGIFVRLAHLPATANKEKEFLKRCVDRDLYIRRRTDFESISGQPLAFWFPEAALSNFRENEKLSAFGEAKSGMSSCNSERFLRAWTEISINKSLSICNSHETANASGARWFPYNKGGGNRRWYGYNDTLINWFDSGSEIKKFVVNNPKDPDTTHWSRRLFNLEYFFFPGITWSAVTSSRFSCRIVRQGIIPGTGSKTIFVEPELAATKSTVGFLNSSVAAYFLEALSPTINFEAGDIAKLPIPKNVNISFSVERLTQLARSDWDAYETSWDFTTLPLLAPEHRAETLAASYATLRAYWKAQTDEMQRLEEENNRIFIDAYGLQDELTPEVPLEEITLTCNPAYRYGGKLSEADLEARLMSDTMAEFLHYAVGCMFGRYSLDTPGLILANQGEGLAEYFARIPEPTFTPDADNVIPVLDGDWFADDITERFRKFLRVSFGEAKFQENLSFVESSLGKDIRKWFTRDFYDYHVRRYKKRPIYWMFASPKGSFQALIYMHRYRPDTVSVVLNDYLREFISKLQSERGRLEKLADDPGATQTQRTKALKDVATVIKQIAELEEWEREVVFPLAQAKIAIDLDDGVKRNYPLFVPGLKPIKGLEAADE
jgi:hypothetical protein